MKREEALRVDLGSAIEVAEQKGIVSQKVSALSRLVKDYRNLVHPGRAIRTGETPDSNSATIVARLLEIILSEIGERKRSNYGYTAEQIVTKLSRDSSSMAILTRLLKDVNEVEIERLILEVIPDRYFSTYQLSEIDNPSRHLLPMLSRLFRIALDIAPETTQIRFAKHFIRILKEESEWTVTTYCHEFFSMRMLRYLGPGEVQLVKEHYLEQLRSAQNEDKWAESITGIGKYLTEQDLPMLLDSLVSRAIRGCSGVGISICRILLAVDDKLTARARTHLNSWISDSSIRYRKLTEAQIGAIKDLISYTNILL